MDNDGTFRVNHLVHAGDNNNWIAPINDDIQDVVNQQVVPVTVVGEWDYKRRTAKYILGNADDIETVFNDIFM